MLASVRLELDGVIDPPDLVEDLGRILNGPTWTVVEIITSPGTLCFAAETWEPILRVRVEDALEEILGGLWRELAHWGVAAGGIRV
jgi:hypothetical protein